MAVKELCERRQEKNIGGQVIFISAFTSGLNNHSMCVEILFVYKWKGCISQSRC